MLLLLLLLLFLLPAQPAAERARAQGRRREVDVRRREEADGRRTQARPEQEGEGLAPGRGGHDPRADAEGGHEGREGHARWPCWSPSARASTNVPDITKKTASDADALLRTKELTLGQASPQPVDPKGLIVTQIPAAGEIVKAGTPVNIFYADPADAENKKKQKDKAKKDGAAGGGGGGGGGGGDKAAAADIIIPAIGKDDLDAYAKKVADLGIVPKVRKEFNDAPKGTLFATDPPGGTKVAAKSTVTLLVSVGQPQVVYTNGKNILRLNGANGRPLDPVASGPSEETNPTWAADGEHVAYTADGRVMLKDLTKKNSAAVELTPAGREFADLAWAPTADRNVLAMDEVIRDAEGNMTDTDLCFGADQGHRDRRSTASRSRTSRSSRHLHWAADGRSILGVGVKNNRPGHGIFGIVRWKVKTGKPAFSADTADWSKGKFLTDIDNPGQGRDRRRGLAQRQAARARVEPRARRSSGCGWPTIRRTSRSPARSRPPCARARSRWRGDSKELLVVSARRELPARTSAVRRARHRPTSVRDRKELNPSGDDPSYQPLTIGG